MRARLRSWALAGLSMGLLLGLAVTLAPPGWAARNSSGSYTLPPGNPVVPGTPISSSWANTTLADLANEVTNSLDRNGRGGMQQPLQLSNGNAGAPSLTFGSDTNTGLFRVSTDTLGASANGVTAQTWTATGSTLSGTLTVSAITSAAPPLQVTGGLDVSGGLDVGGGATISGGATITGDLTASGVAEINSGIQVPGSGDANPGAIVTAIYAATFNIDYPSDPSTGACLTSVQALPGVVTSGACFVSADMSPGNLGAQWAECFVSAAGQVTVRLCNATGGTVSTPARDFRVRVFQ